MNQFQLTGSLEQLVAFSGNSALIRIRYGDERDCERFINELIVRIPMRLLPKIQAMDLGDLVMMHGKMQGVKNRLCPDRIDIEAVANVIQPIIKSQNGLGYSSSLQG